MGLLPTFEIGQLICVSLLPSEKRKPKMGWGIAQIGFDRFAPCRRDVLHLLESRRISDAACNSLSHTHTHVHTHAI